MTDDRKGIVMPVPPMQKVCEFGYKTCSAVCFLLVLPVVMGCYGIRVVGNACKPKKMTEQSQQNGSREK